MGSFMLVIGRRRGGLICILGSYWTFFSFLIYFRAVLLRFREKKNTGDFGGALLTAFS
jgi:hypothetical protein